MYKRLALNKDGKITYCASSEENIGKGRCNHLLHQEDNEPPEMFLKRVSNQQKEYDSKIDFRKLKDIFTQVNNNSKMSKLIKVTVIAFASLTLLSGCSTDNIQQQISEAQTQISQKISDIRSKSSSRPTLALPKVDSSNPYSTTGLTDEQIRLKVTQLENFVVQKSPLGIDYDRTTWEGNQPEFTYTKNGRTYTTQSIRVASIYNSNWYDQNTNTYTDPYTGEKITGNKLYQYTGKGTLQYDHIIPLAYVNRQVGNSWTNEQKSQFAYDQTVGVNVDSQANGLKSDKGPSQFLPAYNAPAYCYTWLCISNKYHIPLAPQDLNVIRKVLSNAKTKDIQLINGYTNN